MTVQRTILVTFAGRRDRMQLLARYADAAIRRGLIDEWHVWDFARNDADRAWLRSLFPATQVTPSHTLEYFRAPRPANEGEEHVSANFSVCAAHDAHVGLLRKSGEGGSYEIVLGGWNNAASAIRRFDNAQALAAVAARAEGAATAVMRATPGLLPEFAPLRVRVEVGAEGVKAYAGDALLLHDPEPVAPGAFELMHRTGYGANGEWRLPGLEAHPARLFVAGPEPHFPKDSMFYNAAYRYYAAHREDYARDILLKCDDDIVYFDLEGLADFIEFRKKNRDYFLVSANVVNNGVCAHFQQSMGAIPDWLKCELPPGGMCGSLWSSGTKAEAVHNLFLERPSAFKVAKNGALVWNERISINFIALLGEDLIHIPDVTADDEHDLCYGVRKRAKKNNCIVSQFVAAHLSFWKQDDAMNIAGILRKYQELAADELGHAT